MQWLWLAHGSGSLSRLAALVERARSLRMGMVPPSQATAGVAIAVRGRSWSAGAARLGVRRRRTHRGR
jgi:hypothetical protein